MSRTRPSPPDAAAGAEPAARRPDVGPAELTELAAGAWGLRGELRELPSDSDRNFVLSTGERKVVLKVYGRGADRGLVTAEAEAHRLARAAGLPCPEWLPTEDGSAIAQVTDRSGAPLLARAISWIDGAHLAQCRKSPGLVADLGRVLGRLDRALGELAHPALSRTIDWDLARAPEVIRERAPAIDDSARRQLVSSLVADTERRTRGRLRRLRRSVIHNDANDYNILVGPAEPPGGPFERFEPSRVTGLLDFGDLVETFTVCEPAIAAAYVTLDRADPVGAIAPLVAAYHEEHPLTEDELDLLFLFARLRLALSVTMAAVQRRAEPDNEYLSISEAPAWRTLRQLARIHPRLAAARLRLACGVEASPRRQQIVAVLQRAEPAPILGTPLEELRPVLLDLSVGTPLLAELRDRNDQNEWWRAIRSVMAEHRAGVGWGCWNEPRGWYTSDVFTADATLEPRTVHLGVDLFVAPGTPVFAPLGGSVHSFKINDRPLDYGGTIVLEHELEPRAGERVRLFTLYGHLAHSSLDSLERGQRVEPGQQLATVGDLHENGGWAPHLHFQIACDLLDHEGDFPGVARPSERDAWLALSPSPNLLLRWHDAPDELGSAAGPRSERNGENTEAALARSQRGVEQSGDPKSVSSMLARRRAALAPSLSLSYREPLWIVRGEGTSLFDQVGRRYLDLVNNVCHVGHAHPHVSRAIAHQAAILNTNTRTLHENVIRLAERLLATLPPAFEVCFFVNSGSEANDLALRIARIATGRSDVVCLEGAYHGNLTTLIDVSPYKHDGPGGAGAPPGVHRLPMPDVYRGRHRGAEAGAEYTTEARRLIAELDRDGGGIAALIAEPILSCGGQIDPPPGYLAAIFEQARDRGAVAIADEVQVGFGRVGSDFWAHRAHGADADIVTLGKPMGNGHPLGAVVTTREVAERFANGMEYFNTFGGNPVSCAAGLAVLDVIEEENLQERALARGEHLLAGLGALAARFPAIGDVRGRGLFLGVELVCDPNERQPDPELAGYLVERLKDRGYLLSTDGPEHNVLKIKPPLVISEQEITRFLEELERILTATSEQ